MYWNVFLKLAELKQGNHNIRLKGKIVQLYTTFQCGGSDSTFHLIRLRPRSGI